MACKEHPNYGGLRTPRSDCKGCWDTYNAVHGKTEKKEDVKPVIVIPEAKSERKKKEKIVEVKPLIEVRPVVVAPEPVQPEIKIDLPKNIKELVAAEAERVIKEILDAKLKDFRTRIAAEMSIAYEHLFIYDRYWNPQMIKFLETEGWAWKSHTYPLADKGIISKEAGDYTLMLRIKRAGNVPMPDFDNEKTRKEYAKKLKEYQEKGK